MTAIRLTSALNENGTLKSSVWYNVLGEDYLGLAVSHRPTDDADQSSTSHTKPRQT
jgi:hypothetical protein